jgi:uncharacterized protein YfdQ (DUF2303 family)
MADKAATTELHAEPLPSLLPSPFEFDLETATRLGARAEGVEIVNIDNVSGDPGIPAKVPVALHRGETPAAKSIKLLFEDYRQFPARKTGTANVQTFDSFCTLTNRHKTDDSAIFADMDWRKPAFTTVVDYHELQNGGKADNGKHRIHYAFPLSEEWKKWMEMNSQTMKQQDFAWFLEDRILEVSSPTEEDKALYETQFGTKIALASQLVELSRGLNVRVDSKVKNAQTLNSGEATIQFEETHTDAAGQPLKVPGLFMLYIAPFFMGDKVRVPVRLRYRVKDGNIFWFYDIYRPDLVITEFVRGALFEAERLTSLPTFEGAPEMPA